MGTILPNYLNLKRILTLMTILFLNLVNGQSEINITGLGNDILDNASSAVALNGTLFPTASPAGSSSEHLLFKIRVVPL